MAVLGMNVRCATTFKDYKPPLRVYVHNDGLREAYHGQPSEAVRHVREMYLLQPIANHSLVIAIAWGRASDHSKIVDLYGYALGEDHKENPIITPWRTCNGELQNRQLLPCGDELIILGEEEKHRRGSKTLEEYLSTFPRTLSFIPQT